jgi:hypothetical protein
VKIVDKLRRLISALRPSTGLPEGPRWPNPRALLSPPEGCVLPDHAVGPAMTPSSSGRGWKRIGTELSIGASLDRRSQ